MSTNLHYIFCVLCGEHKHSRIHNISEDEKDSFPIYEPNGKEKRGVVCDLCYKTKLAPIRRLVCLIFVEGSSEI